MIGVTIVKIFGLLLVSFLWFYFAKRERSWWIFCLGCLGLVAALVQITPVSMKIQNIVAGGYIVLVIVFSNLLRGLGYRPHNPIRF